MPQQQKQAETSPSSHGEGKPVKKAKTVNMKKEGKEGRGGLAGHLQSNIREPRRPEGC
jgi:hypothetical protein